MYKQRSPICQGLIRGYHQPEPVSRAMVLELRLGEFAHPENAPERSCANDALTAYS